MNELEQVGASNANDSQPFQCLESISVDKPYLIRTEYSTNPSSETTSFKIVIHFPFTPNTDRDETDLMKEQLLQGNSQNDLSGALFLEEQQLQPSNPVK